MDRAIGTAARAAARDEAPVLRLDHVEHALVDPLGVDVLAVDAQPLGQRDPVGRQPLAHLVGRGERVLGRDVIAVGAQAAEVAGAGGDQLRPPVRQVRRHLDADAGQQLAGGRDEPLHVLDRHLARPLGQRQRRVGAKPGAPVRVGCLGGDIGRFLAVVAAVGDEVLQDHLLQMAVLGVNRGQRAQRLDPVGLGLADADEDAAGERDPQLAGGADRVQPPRRVLGRRALVRDQIRPDRLQHQSLRGGHLAQPREVLATERAEVGVRQDAALERPFAGPDDVGDEIRVAELVQPLADARVVIGRLAGQDQQLLDVAPRGAVEQRLHLGGRVQVGLMGGERAVLAVRAARPGERECGVARERDPAPHPM